MLLQDNNILAAPRDINSLN